MILANNTKWVSIHLFRCCKANFDPLRNFHHVIFITVLFLVWTVGRMELHNSLGHLVYEAICNTFYSKWQSDKGIVRSFSGTCKSGEVILKIT